MNNYNITLKEMNEMGKKIISEQSEITLEKAKAQVSRIKKASSQKDKKSKSS